MTSDEQVFYNDQKGERIFRLSEEIDQEFANELNNDVMRQEAKIRELLTLEEFINPVEYQEVTPSHPEHRRRLDFSSCEPTKYTDDSAIEISPRTPENDTSPKPVRNVRNVDVKFKDAIATVSYRTALSVPKARVALQAVCEKLYGHKYYLSVEEKEKFEPTLPTILEVTPLEHKSKKPRTKEDYKTNYSMVLPSAKVISEYKHDKALHQEISAAKALASIEGDTRCTLHFDTTGRSRVEGEWPALILNFLSKDENKCKMYRLRAIFFAYETREHIVNLIVQTLKRLSVAVDGRMTVKQLWENIYAIMTDAVTKNLGVEYQVATQLESDYVPKHILCKSHTCEKLDESCVNVLVKIESELRYGDMLIKRQPRLKSFIRQSKCIVVCAMKALLKLVSHEDSAKPTSLAKEFDIQLEKDGVSKSFSLYKERRFTKLGYTAGALVECLPQFKKILEQTPKTNMLTEACKLYLESDYIIAALKALANFTYTVTMPYLNCIERSNQNDLVRILKNLYDDLKVGKMDTLKDFHVPWTHVNMSKQEPKTVFDNHLLKLMCEHAAEGIEMQCAREYWAEDAVPRATQIHMLSYEERENIPTENMEAERYLAKFGYLASISAVRSNKFFKAQRIRDDLMFNASMSSEEDVDKSARRIRKALNEMELSWTKEQKLAWNNKVEMAMKKKARTLEYKDVILRKCKDHGGPFVNIRELKEFINQTTDQNVLKRGLRQEIGFQKMLHPVDVRERSHLYKMNFLTTEELVENLTILLDTEIDTNEGEVIFFPCEEEIMEILISRKNEVPTWLTSRFSPQQPLAVLWDCVGKNRFWSIGFFLDVLDDQTIRVEHLQQKNDQTLSMWIQPDSDDIQLVKDCQVLPCDVDGYWDFSNPQCSTFIVNNIANIEESFNNISQ